MNGKQYLVKFKDARGDSPAEVIELKPSWFDRLRTATQWVVTGNKVPDFFGPGAPLSPEAPPQIAGRQFDFPSSYNTVQQPRAGEFSRSMSFGMMRTLADAYDFLRMLIETRKDQLAALEWKIVNKDDKVKPDNRCAMLTEFFERPDKEHNWDDWLRMITEDQIVLDAATLYPQRTRGGDLYALQPVDGSTIKRLIDDYGRTPTGDDVPAYQQILKGLPALDYKRGELIYKPRNPRTNRIYGYGVVEQIYTTVMLGLNRQAYQLQYYTEGSTPDLIMSAPPDWTPDQVKAFSEYWDSRLKGNAGGKRSTMFVFNGMDVLNTKEGVLTDKFDEWLARVTCYAFGISPTPFINQVNRATSEQSAESAKEEGIGPHIQWVENLITDIIVTQFGFKDLKFKFNITPDVAPEVQDKIDDAQVRRGQLLINEARAAKGLDPLEGGDVALIYTGTGATPLVNSANAPMPPDPLELAQANADAKAKAFGNDDPNPKGKPNAKDAVEKTATTGDLHKARGIAATLTEIFGQLAESCADSIAHHVGLAKVAGFDVEQLLAQLDMSPLNGAYAVILSALSPVYGQAFAEAVSNVVKDAIVDIQTIPATQAAAYAAQRAAELVGTDSRGGALGESTRLLIRGVVAKALADEVSKSELAEQLAASYGFSAQRAMLIADTEVEQAIMSSKLAGWAATGVVKGKAWACASECCDVCLANEAEGVIPLMQAFSSGDLAPLAHPNCHCDLVPELDDAE